MKSFKICPICRFCPVEGTSDACVDCAARAVHKDPVKPSPSTNAVGIYLGLAVFALASVPCLAALLIS